MSQHVEGREDVSPLHHLPQRTPLQHLGTEDVPRLLRQEANVNEDLNIERKQVRNIVFFVFHDVESKAPTFRQVQFQTISRSEILHEQFSPPIARIHV